MCYAASKLPQKPASECRNHSVHDIKRKGSSSFRIVLVVSQRATAAAEAWELIMFCDLLHSSVRTVNESRGGGGYRHNEKGDFRVSGVYHLSQSRKHQPGPTVSVSL